MTSYSLSRSSCLYRFVFGRQKGKLEGFPEPRNQRISLGLFVGLLFVMIIMRTVGYGMLFLMNSMLRFIVFMSDGSYLCGKLLQNPTLVKIEPWPKIKGRRLSPWPIFIALVVLSSYWYYDFDEALDYLVFLILITILFLSKLPGENSLATEFAERNGPMIEEKIVLAYYREPKFFPSLHLVD